MNSINARNKVTIKKSAKMNDIFPPQNNKCHPIVDTAMGQLYKDATAMD